MYGCMHVRIYVCNYTCSFVVQTIPFHRFTVIKITCIQKYPHACNYTPFSFVVQALKVLAVFSFVVEGWIQQMVRSHDAYCVTPSHYLSYQQPSTVL